MKCHKEISTDVAVEKYLRKATRGIFRTVFVVGACAVIAGCATGGFKKFPNPSVVNGIYNKQTAVGPPGSPDMLSENQEEYGGENPMSIFPAKEIKHGDVLENPKLGATASLYPNPRAKDEIVIKHINYPGDPTRGGSVNYKGALITHAEWKEISGEHVLVYSGVIEGKPFMVWNIVYRGEKPKLTDDGIISTWVFYIKGEKSKKKTLSKIKKVKGITPEEIRRRLTLADSIERKATAEKVRMQIGDLAKK